MNILDRIRKEYKEAFKSKNIVKKDILNYILAQIKNKQIELGREPTEEEIIKLIQKEIKSRQESISFLEKSWNTEEVKIEKQKIEILKEYLPKMLSEDELKQIIEEKIKELNITDLKKQRWQLIWSIMKQYWPRVDGKLLNNIINWLITD